MLLGLLWIVSKWNVQKINDCPMEKSMSWLMIFLCHWEEAPMAELKIELDTNWVEILVRWTIHIWPWSLRVLKHHGYHVISNTPLWHRSVWAQLRGLGANCQLADTLLSVWATQELGWLCFYRAWDSITSCWLVGCTQPAAPGLRCYESHKVPRHTQA